MRAPRTCTFVLLLAGLLLSAGCSDDNQSTPDRGTVQPDMKRADGPGKADLGRADRGKSPDSRRADSGRRDFLRPDMVKQGDAGLTPTPHTVVISEYLPNPDKVTDDKGEWFELYNNTAQSVDLDGWTVKDNKGSSTSAFTISKAKGTTVIPAGGYLVLGISSATATNGGVKVDYAYGTSWSMGNDSDEIILVNTAGTVVDEVRYDQGKGWPLPKGASLSLKSVTLDNNTSQAWCEEKTAWTGSTGDRGTPGAKTGCAP